MSFETAARSLNYFGSLARVTGQSWHTGRAAGHKRVQPARWPRGLPRTSLRQPLPLQVNRGWPHVKDEPAYCHANYCHSWVSLATVPQIWLIKAIHPPGWMGSSSHRQSVPGWCHSRIGFTNGEEQDSKYSQTLLLQSCSTTPRMPHSLQGQGQPEVIQIQEERSASVQEFTQHSRSSRLYLCAPRVPANNVVLLSVSMETDPSHHVVEEGGQTGGVHTNTKQSRWLSVSYKAKWDISSHTFAVTSNYAAIVSV